MWMECDALYFARRAKQEREAAIGAHSSEVRDAHLQMARRFEELSDAISFGADRFGGSQALRLAQRSRRE